jgi:hypothetical protein
LRFELQLIEGFMTISNKIAIDGKDYKVLAGGYMRGSRPPKTVRRGVLGNTIVSMGPGSAERPVKARLWVPYAPTSPFGSLADLEVAALKFSVSYTDHITNDSSKWGSGTFNITILNMDPAHFYDAPRPEPGYIVEIEWTKVLS